MPEHTEHTAKIHDDIDSKSSVSEDADPEAEERAVKREELVARRAEARQKILMANAPWWRGATELLGRGSRILRAGDSPDDDYAPRAGVQHIRQSIHVDAADGEPGFVACQLGGGTHQRQPGRSASGLGRGRPTRPDAEIVDVLGDRRADLLTIVGGTADHRVRADDLARHAQRQVVLAQVQHGGAGGTGDVGAVVDGQQGAVPPRRVGEHLQRRQFVAGLQGAQPVLRGRALVAQLNDVDPAGQRGVGELGQIASVATRIGAQIKTRGGEPVDG